MHAEEARSIWEKEVEDRAKGYIEFIKNKIIKYTYQDNVFLFYFEFPDLPKNITGRNEDIEEEFISGVFARIVSYFSQLGFKVKSSEDRYRIWIALLKRDTLKSDSFTDNLSNIIKVRGGYRAFIEGQDILKEMEKQIREKAKRSRSLSYKVTLNVANEKSLLVEDLINLVKKLEEQGFTVNIEGDLITNPENKAVETIEEWINEGLFFEEMLVELIIRW
ncbi:MAG: hypothetical protein ACOYVD_02635 [Bacillota bacterium]